MAISLRPTAEQLSEWELIIDIPAEKFLRITNKLEQSDETFIKPSQIRDAINGILETKFCKPLVTQILGLSILRREKKASADEIVSALDKAFTASNWDDIKKSKWSSVKPHISKLIYLDEFYMVAKAIDLSFDYQNLLNNICLVTDIRPVFNRKGSEIVGSIISQTLSLSYRSRDGRRYDITIALDEKDIENLKEECDRAIEKGEAARKLISGKVKIPSFHVGEEIYDL